MVFSLTTGSTAYSVESTTTLPLNQWTHIVATYGSGSQTLFINGVQNVTQSVSGSIGYGTSQDLAIGENTPYSPCCPWNGLLDEVRISSIARSADWIATEYNNQSSPITFYDEGSPAIYSLSPTSGSFGTSVTLTGKDFGSSQGSSTVTFGGAPATSITSWSNTSIVVTVPAGASSGNVIVTVSGINSNGLNFAITPTGWSDQDVGSVGVAGKCELFRFARNFHCKGRRKYQFRNWEYSRHV